MQRLISRLQYLPISVFTATMGLVSLALVAQRSARIWGLPSWHGQVCLIIAAAVLGLFTALYLAKALRYQALAAAELKHSQTLFFFAAFPLSLFLLAVAFLDTHSETSRTLWVAGVVLQSVLILLMGMRPMAFQIQDLNPSWFIPVIGNLLVPIAGVRHYSPEISWFFFSVGIVSWFVLLVLITFRFIFHSPLPPRLAPMRSILIAPPAAAFLGYLSLVGGVDPFARVMYYVALFAALLVVLQYRSWIGLRFAPSWWQFSFPVAIVTLATMRLYELSHWSFLKGLAAVLYSLLVATVAMLTVLTLHATVRNKVLVPES